MSGFSIRLNDVVRDLVRIGSDMSPTTWAVVAVVSVVFGYAMLKGMNINGR
jgi:hypothetical protein